MIGRQVVIALKLLQPHSQLKCVHATVDRELVAQGEQITVRAKITVSIRSGECDLRRRVESGAAADGNGTDRPALHKPRQINRGVPVEDVSSAREAQRDLVEDPGGEDVRFTEARHLIPHSQVHQAERVGRGRVSRTVVNRIHPGEHVLVGKVMVKPGGSEVFVNTLQRIVVGDRNSATEIRSIRYGPERQQRLNARDGAGSRCIIGHERDVTEAKTLPKSLIISEKKCLVLSDGTPQRSSEHIPLKPGNLALIEEITRVQSAVPQKFVGASVDLIGSRGRHDVDLRSGALSVFCSVSIPDRREFANRVDTQELPAGSARGDVDVGCTRIFHAVQQE